MSDTLKRNDSSMTDMSGLDDDPKVYHVRKSRMIRLVNWWTVSVIYYPYILMGAAGVLVAQVIFEAYENWDSLITVYKGYQNTLSTSPPVAIDVGWKATALFVACLWFLGHRKTSIYLLDFAVFEPPQSWKVTHEQLLEIMRRQKCFTHDSIEFMSRILSNSGTSQSTAWPPSITKCLTDENVPSDRSVDGARAEAEYVMYDIVEKALEKTKTRPKDIDILIVNCSLFSPTPSLCSMIIHKFGFRNDVKSFNLSGMGCSAGIISIDLAKDLLIARPNSKALIVSTENLTQNLYHGNERSMLLQNTLFRCGGAAIILSNKWQDAMRAKMKLLTAVRTQGEGNEAYKCVFECEDEEGHRGVRLSKKNCGCSRKSYAR
mmetsp:Transcript_20271/g.29955  ORF Transcript_20271/g.29955 Transcript_20271/m.29955 type:complete len:375 (+) Transcript_20271:148-1272(+)